MLQQSNNTMAAGTKKDASSALNTYIVYDNTEQLI
jgi:hypothetical protein